MFHQAPICQVVKVFKTFDTSPLNTQILNLFSDLYSYHDFDPMAKSMMFKLHNSYQKTDGVQYSP